MTQSFDEWFEKNGELYREPTSDERYLFEAGATSRQAEVDELQHKVKCEREISLFADKLCVDLQSQVDELRKRIDKADRLIMSFGNSIDVPLRNSLIDAIRGLEDL